MTQDILITRWLYQNLYGNLPTPFIDIDLDTIEILSNIMKSDDMIEARKLLDEKVSTWK
jgi:hypothetical protein